MGSVAILAQAILAPVRATWPGRPLPSFPLDPAPPPSPRCLLAGQLPPRMAAFGSPASAAFAAARPSALARSQRAGPPPAQAAARGAHREKPPAAPAVLLGAAACAAASIARPRTRRTRMRLAPRAEMEAHAMANAADRSEANPGKVVQMAQDVGLKLDVKPWEFLSSIAKDAARSWFIKRAEDRGIQWTESVQLMSSRQAELDRLFEQVRDPDLQCPAYYTQPFHGYDDGNLSWKAARELEAATQSMRLGYYQAETTWEEAQERFRGSARAAIADRRRQAQGVAEAVSAPPPTRLLDVGCSGGFSTRQMADTFPSVRATGLDLGPYYLATAKSTYPNLEFTHGLAEATGFESGLFDVVTFNFLLHFLARSASRLSGKHAGCSRQVG
ncbi:unnamed protein product [Prorocentrum cordatum]|uniref:Methyltransferase domain-containing protein n=1 Tax=Prorocentrum cordatum TaxID=2364126 RepID=A0ABN9PEA5_9DINO|nr:unnamed protein product [Polarella glacialis]